MLALVPEERRATLLAQPVRGEPTRGASRSVCRATRETVFFDV